ncbi:hypothetical protein [Actinoplanes utahensis]|uniref:Lipoprotein n=1 Tax=Actinoplanes utahensis TaxID=1869 RepID=A0A0A6XDB7_ACTUT|nr:hypothetical protein [Actinoplanes utahensis]KHD78092.1 hypothetical protein MB27_06245 [Actinoplanes utahensis]GIF30544.1 hypothetical protein Aut01nite_35300 [Actinoplanes utahensis]
MKRFLAGAVAGVTTLTLTVGCANQLQQLEPKLELKKAAENLGASGKAGFTLKAGGNVEDLIAFAKKESGTGSDAFTNEDADIIRKIYNSSFTLGWDKAGDGIEDDRALFNATIDGVTGAEVRVVDKVAYFKVPVNELVTKFGGTKADVDEIRTEVGASVPGIDTLLNGGWVSISADDVAKFAEGTTGVKPSASVDPAEQEKIVAEFKTSAENLLESADIVRDEKDKTHLVVTTSTVKAFNEGKRLLDAIAKLAPAETGEVLKEATAELGKETPADKPIVLDLWIDNGNFKAFEINLLQFDTGNTGRASVRVEIATGAEISAPGDAKKLDVSKIVEGLSQGMGGVTSDLDGGAGFPPSSTSTVAENWASLLGSKTLLLALSEGGKPATHLAKAVADFNMPGTKVKIVRAGVAQVTSGSTVACLTLPATTSGEPKVLAGAC